MVAHLLSVLWWVCCVVTEGQVETESQWKWLNGPDVAADAAWKRISGSVMASPGGDGKSQFVS